MFEDKSKNCWDVEGTLCNHDLVINSLFEEISLNKCMVCIYYKQFNS
jgi:hypothetical protein